MFVDHSISLVNDLFSFLVTFCCFVRTLRGGPVLSDANVFYILHLR